MSKRKPKQDIINIYKLNNLTIEDEQMIGRMDNKLVCYDKEGYKYLVNTVQLSRNQLPQKYSKYNPYTIYNINHYISLNAPEYELITQEYKYSHYKGMVWRIKNSELPDFKMSVDAFCNAGQRHPNLKFISMVNKQRKSLESIVEQAYIALKQNNQEDWTLEINEEYNYKRFNSMLLFKNNDGYYSKGRLNDLTNGNKLKLFSMAFPGISIQNMITWTNQNTDYIFKDSQIYTGTQSEYKYICKVHGEFSKKWHGFYYLENGCPICNTSHGEKKIRKLLIDNNIYFEQQYKFKDLYVFDKKGKRKFYLRFDFAIKDDNGRLKYLIEFNGLQHYKIIPYFGGIERFNIGQKRDTQKINYCKYNDIPLLVIKYDKLKTLSFKDLIIGGMDNNEFYKLS